jgi:autotransporter-associated beta strand protein
LTIANNSFTTAKLIINNLKGAANSVLTVSSPVNVNGTLILTGTSTYGGRTILGTGAAAGTPTLQADEGAGLLTTSDLELNGGVFQTSTGSFTRTLSTVGGVSTMAWNLGGGGFSAITNPLTVDIGGAGAELVWGDVVGEEGTKILGPLKFGSVSSNAKTTFIDPIDLNPSATTGLVRTVTVTNGAGGDSTEMSAVIRNTGADAALTKNGTGTLILSAVNTYTGTTTIGAGTLSVASIGNTGANSNIGKHGTIHLGATTTAGTLKYTGTGETSDKVLDLAGTTGGGTIDQSGAGLLKFTSNLTATGAGAKTLTLQGSTAGTGEIGGVISDSTAATAVTKTGTGIWALSGASANTYTGLTTVSGGELDLNKTGANAIGNGLTVTGAGAVAKLLQSNQISDAGAVTVTTNGVLNMNGNSDTVASLAGAAATGNVLLTGNITIGGSANTSFAGTITGSGGNFIKNGTGTQTFTNAGNTYAGNTTINAGTISVDADASIGAGTLNLSGGKFNASASRTVATPNAINLTADSSITTSSAATTVDFDLSSNSIGGSAGTLTFKNEGADASTDIFSPRFSGSGFNFARDIVIDNGTTGKTELNSYNTTGTTQTFSGIISGTGSYRRNASTAGSGGTAVFTNANTYQGGTNVARGTLLANNGTNGSATGTGPVSVGGNGRLGGNGSVSGLVTVAASGIVGAGDPATNSGIGTLRTNGGLTIQEGASLNFDLGAPGTSDLIDVTAGALALPATNTPSTLVNLFDVGGLALGTYTLIDYTGSFTGSLSNLTPSGPGGFSYTLNNNTGATTIELIVSAAATGDWNGDTKVNAADYVTWRKDPGSFGNDPGGYVTWRENFSQSAASGSGLGQAAVPEPASLVLLMLGVGVSAGLRRRR